MEGLFVVIYKIINIFKFINNNYKILIIMDINHSIESLREKALRHFPDNPTFVQRSLARIPVFFIALTAFFNEAFLGLKASLFKAFQMEPGAIKPESTAKTHLASAKIFSLLWNIPDQTLINAAKFAAVTASLEGVKAGDVITHQEPNHAILSFKYFDLSTAISNTAEQITAFEDLKSTQTTSSLLQSSTNPQPVKEYLNSLVFNLDTLPASALPESKLSETELSRLKIFLDNNFQSKTFNLELALAVKDESIKTLFLRLIAGSLGSIDHIATSLKEKQEALELYTAYKKSKDPKADVKLGIAEQDIEELESASLKERTSSEDSLSTSSSYDSLASDRTLAAIDPSKIKILRDILKNEVLKQLAREFLGKSISVSMPGFSSPNFKNISYYYQNLDCLKPSNDPDDEQRTFRKALCSKLYSHQLFETMFQKLNELKPEGGYKNQKQILTALLASSQAYDGDLFTRSLFPRIDRSFAQAALTQGLSFKKESRLGIDLNFIVRPLDSGIEETYGVTIAENVHDPRHDVSDISFEKDHFIIKSHLPRAAVFAKTSDSPSIEDHPKAASDEGIRVPFNLESLMTISDESNHVKMTSEGPSFAKTRIGEDLV